MAIFTAASLLTGYDGLGIGLRKVVPSLRTIVYVEREIYPVANLVAKIKAGKLDDAPVWSDITTFDGKPFAGLVDILHAGIPCQPWSVAGKQKGITDERWIWRDIFRVIVEIMPQYIFLEEVPGFVRGGGLGYVLSDLAQAGYDAEWDYFTAAEVGAPHKRERLFILAHSNEQGLEGQERRQPQRIRGGSERCSELANGNGSGCKEQRRTKPIQQGHSAVECSGSRWPARPGQPQYEWECPRVMVDTKSNRNRRRPEEIQQEDGRQKPELCRDAEGTSKTAGQTKSRLGRTVNGTCSRVDRLRLLGNGVVPQCAELAFRTLLGLFE